MDVKCSSCAALHFKQEKVRGKTTFNVCCRHGRISLTEVGNDYPDVLKRLLLRQDPRWKVFLERIRSYNSAISFASTNCQRQDMLRQRSETVPYVFRVQGKVYTLFNTSAHPPAGQDHYGSRRYGQLYVVDPEEASRHRQSINANDGVDFELMSELDALMRNQSPHARAFEMLREVENEELERLRQQGRDVAEPPEVHLAFSTHGVDPRTYNAPRSNEVAAVFVQNAEGYVPPPCLLVKNRNGSLRQLSSLDEHLDALTYPVFFPTGQAGWRKEMPYSVHLSGDKRQFLSRREHLCYALAEREGVFNPLHYGCKLTQEYLVITYARMESDRLLWLSENQQFIRANVYSVQNQARLYAQQLNMAFEPVTVLPSTHPGSPRYMQKHYQNSMAIVRRWGRPDIFLTITCNPAWEEIKEACRMKQPDGTEVKLTAADRPTVLARVFRLKLNTLLKEINDGLFGTPAAHIHVVEFQKRGLPHAHLLITLAEGHKLTTTQLIDSFLSAEVPDQEAEPELYELVKSHMIHGPCNNGHWSPCLKGGVCEKKFPKDYHEVTSINEEGYAKLRRPDNGRFVDFGNGKVADNGFVVSYCPYLLLRYNAHINVECVSGIRAVKYLYKYCYKGFDRAQIDVTGEHLILNEIERHINARYISPPDASMRTFGFPLQGKTHVVIPLDLHLPGELLSSEPEDEIQDEPDGGASDGQEEDEELIDEPFAAAPVLPEPMPQRKSMLDAYFLLCASDSFAKTKKYLEIPEFYRWEKTRGRWTRRIANRRVVGRLLSASVSKPELVCLRLLLLHVTGASSFVDLRRDVLTPSHVHPSFQAACVARGLIVTDDEWRMCLREACSEKMPVQMRRLFALILIHNSPTEPLALWEEFQRDLSEDYRRAARNDNRGIRRALREIVRQVAAEGINFAARFPMFPPEGSCDDTEEIDIDEEERLARCLYATLTDEQKQVVDLVMKHIVDLERGVFIGPRCVFISGKSYCYRCIYHMVRARMRRASVMASTGVAATVLPNAKTAHKTFGLPVPLVSDSECAINEFAPPAELKDSVCFLWDEITVASRYGLEAVDRKMRAIRHQPDLPFGGAVFVTGGDWKQTHPILPRSTPNEALGLSVKYSPIWRFFEECHLTTNMRARSDPAWAQYLLQVGNGQGFEGNEGEILLPQAILSGGNLVEEVFGDLFSRRMSHSELGSYLCKRAIIAPLNRTCDEYNAEIITRLPGQAVEHLSVDEVVADTVEAGEYYSTEFLNTLEPSELPPHRLTLKPGCIVMLLRNLRVRDGLCNGSRLLCTKVGRRFVEVMHLSGPLEGSVEFLPRISLISSDKNLPFKFKRHQYPVKLAYSFSINKAQGQTLEFCGVDLTYDVFSHGQLYVSLSRARSSTSIRVKIRRDKPTVHNVVYKSILS